MLETLKVAFMFVAGLFLLIKGGDWFVDSASSIARRFRIPEILIGATVVSIGTTLPEVMVSLQGAIGGQGAMAYGNATGSVICNTALIAAITVAVKPSGADKKSMKIPVIFFYTAAAIYVFVAYFSKKFSRAIGIVLLTIFVIYMAYSVISAFKITKGKALADNTEPNEKPKGSTAKDVLLLVIGAACIAVGAKFLIESATAIAKALSVPETVIALTVVALGTSLPELVTAITSLVKGHGALSLGNIIGANLFNLVLVCGVSITAAPFPLPSEKTFMGYNASLVVDMPVMLAVMSILCIPALIRGKLSRWQGVLLLCIYAVFLIFQFVL